MIKTKINALPSIYGHFSNLSEQYNAVNLTQGAPDFDTPEWLVEKASFYIKKGFNQYAPVAGALALRKAIRQKINYNYGCARPIDDIIVTAGAIEGIFLAISTYIQQDDEVIMFDPVFDAYVATTELYQGKCIRLDLLDNGNIEY